jgi:hypothetical protein
MATDGARENDSGLVTNSSHTPHDTSVIDLASKDRLIPPQSGSMFDLPKEVRLLIYKELVVKPGSAVGAPEPGSEVPKEHFIQDYRSYRNLELALSCRDAHDIVSELFFSRNRFEFHYPSDFCLFLRSITDNQRDQIFHIDVYWSMTLPGSTEIDMGAYKFRQFPDLSDTDMELAFRDFSNGLVLARSCNRLRSLQVRFRHRTHLEALHRPVSGIWETAWRDSFYTPPVPVLDAPFAIWDYKFTNVFEYLFHNAKDCNYDTRVPARNVLAKDIDAFVDKTDIPIEMYDIEADCDTLRNTIHQAIHKTVVDGFGHTTHRIAESACLCCDQIIRRIEQSYRAECWLGLHSLSQFCWVCRSCNGNCAASRTSPKEALQIKAEMRHKAWWGS